MARLLDEAGGLAQFLTRGSLMRACIHAQLRTSRVLLAQGLALRAANPEALAGQMCPEPQMWSDGQGS